MFKKIKCLLKPADSQFDQVEPFKVFFTGSEGNQWALDHDLIHLRKMAQTFSVEVPVKKAEVVHSVWWRVHQFLSLKEVEKSKVIASIADDPRVMMGTPVYLKSAQRVCCWLTEYTEGQDFLTRVGIPSLLFPDTIDMNLFSPPNSRLEATAALKSKFNIPFDKYLIGNFHRDSSMDDLQRPKKQKGADIFLEILKILKDRGYPIHVILTGPRRHWLRNSLNKAEIPYTFIGTVTELDDVEVNTLPQEKLIELYHGLDLYLIASRWEGAPNAVLECAATRTPVISTWVGQCPDILNKKQCFKDIVEGADLISEDIDQRWLQKTLNECQNQIQRYHSYEAIQLRLKGIYLKISRFKNGGQSNFHSIKATESLGKKIFKKHKHFIRKEPFSKIRIALWNEFKEGPYGGANQFMKGLEKAFHEMGMETQRNSGSGADAHILQAVWFDKNQFKKERQKESVVIHRIDGPIQLYRGNDFESDKDCYAINKEFADITVLQSAWSMEQTHQLGFKPRNPVLIRNAADQNIFFKKNDKKLDKNRKIRLISVSWSDNPRKGLDFYKRLDKELDWNRYEYIFVGRINATFKNIQVLEPQSSLELSKILHDQDIYITASQNDPCSNSVLEALSCGLPTLYLQSGGHPELVDYGGLPFESVEHFLIQLNRLSDYYDYFQELIWVPSMREVAETYLDTIRTAIELKTGER